MELRKFEAVRSLNKYLVGFSNFSVLSTLASQEMFEVFRKIETYRHRNVI